MKAELQNTKGINQLLNIEVDERFLSSFDCYVNSNFGLFIPRSDLKEKSYFFCTDNSYVFKLFFYPEQLKEFFKIELQNNHYLVEANSPNKNDSFLPKNYSHYYLICIEKKYFESQYKLYSKEEPSFIKKQFGVCTDILKIINLYALECSKQMKNAEITLNAQTTLLTHWIIRSLLGENYDMRTISSNYGIAKIEHYFELHYAQELSLSQLASMVNMSVSTFVRTFKKETGKTPKEYLNDIRITHSKRLLLRQEYSISDVAIDCGFNSTSYFTSCFSKSLGITPSQYRQNQIK